MANSDEGIQSSPPPIPPAARALGLTQANLANRVTITLPATHWSHSMKVGETKIENGAVFEHEPAGKRQQPLLVEVPLNKQPKFVLPTFDGKMASLQKAHQANKTIVDWLARYNGRSLGTGERNNLAKVYVGASAQCTKLGDAALKAKTDDERARLRQQAAMISATMLLNERKIFKPNKQAQIDRYGRPLIAESRTVPSQRRLEAALVGILRGDYLAKPAPRNIHVAASANDTDRVATAIAGRGTTFRVRTGLVGDPAASGSMTTTIVKNLGAPQTLGFEGRLYLAEHDAEDVDWEEEFGIDGILHTSIVGGVWRIDRQDVEVRTYDRPIGGLLAVSASAERRSVLGNLISTHRERRVCAMFAGWLVGYGAASTYFADDDLTLFAAGTFASYELADRWIAGLTPTASGMYYPIRGCSYSVGNYGLHWVCHQAANAFALRKWGYIPVQYPASWVLFGPFGLLGIAERTNIYPRNIQKGCVPGSQCFYNVVPPYAEPVLAQVVERLMDGHGYGLDVHWNPNKGQWVASEASYSTKAIPIPGWNETLSVQQI